ncbi:MAG: cyclodeaminase/cyclohydrolase family protein [Desulforhabdus sp.]|jgi:formiminotetrahydrofolate cyclodeaminase|nr:cyclodeaminase/cyclohydrolase family protein [Desulforhabdus sp.]
MSESFIAALAEPRPDPGGGAAAAYAGSVACALMVKILRLEANRHPQQCESHSYWTRLLEQAHRLTEQFESARENDVRAYLEFSAARKQGKRASELSPFLHELVRCPELIMLTAQQAVTLCSDMGTHCRKHLIADLHVAQELLGAVLQGAFHIACANLPLMESGSKQQSLLARLSITLNDGLENLKHASEVLFARSAGTTR